MPDLHALILVTLMMVSSLASAAESLVTATFPADGITKVVLRASAAKQVSIVARESSPASVRVSGVASGGARGYQPPDPDWKETPPAEWGLKFVARRFGDTLVVSSENEMHYIHHHYTLESIKLELPAGIEIVREPRALDGNGQPNLASP